jgi:hypothetical protein
MAGLNRIQIVFARCPDGVSADDWNGWYDAHLREILTIPGFVSAQRFAIEPLVGAGEGPGWTHIALYEVEGDFAKLAEEMVRMSLGTAADYIEFKKTDTAGPPLPYFWDDVRFASWNCRSLGERIHEQ